MSVLHYFNPGHENAVLNRFPSYTPPANMSIIMRELASLPMWYASSDDVVMVGDGFDKGYYYFLLEQGFSLPSLLYDRELRKFNELSVCMWGISPHAIRLFENLNKAFDINLKLPHWDEKYIYLTSRMNSRDVLSSIKDASSNFESVELPIFYSDIESVETVIESSEMRMLVKSPYSSSGRGLLWLPANGLSRTENQIISGMLNKQGSISIEPVYDKILDFAMEFMIDEYGAISFVGYSLFSTNDKGAYAGNILMTQSDILNEICNNVDISIIEEAKGILLNILSDCYSSVYKGCIGVDMIVFKEGNSYKLHPCVEINMRYNMGYLAIKLFENYICQTSKGVYNLDFSKDGQAYLSHCEMMDRYPLKIEDGRVKSGYLSLCPVEKNTKYRAYILVE